MHTARNSGIDALQKLKSTEAPAFLAPTSSLSDETRSALKFLFTELKPHNPKSPFDELLVDGFDAEQVWQQIDIQSHPLLSTVKQELKRFEKNPEEIRKLGDLGLEFDDEDDDEELEEAEESEEEEDEEEEEEEEDEEEEEEEEENEGIEDKFFKIKDLEEFLKEGEAEEYGRDYNNKKVVTKGKKQTLRDDYDDEDEEEDDDEDEDEEFGAFGGDDDNEDDEKQKKATYKDFFGGKKKETAIRFEDVTEDGEAERGKQQGNEKLSTHEKEQLKLQTKIAQMEKANLDPKHWTMQGEITGKKRPINSALEVDLDFEHNARPPPVITEEVAASLEELIKSRIIESRYDDVERAPNQPSKPRRQVKETDDNKSKKGLAEIYAEEFVQKANPAFAPATLADGLKKEAGLLFKKLCLKLDALSHFHFTPKPVIEEMSIQTNLPAIAMEEVAPVAVSDAAMLAPEEVFSGKGTIKDESELTQEDRKRRRAQKKRKFKAAAAREPLKKPRDTVTDNPK